MPNHPAQDPSLPARPAHRPASIYDVARAAGVGVVTVSRVVNGKPGVSDELRAYVQDLIKALGYVPKDPEHRPGPKARRAAPAEEAPPLRTIDLHIAFPLKLGEFPFRVPIYSRMLDEIEMAAEAAGVELYVRQGKAAIPEEIIPHLCGRIHFGRAGTDWRHNLIGGGPADLPQVWVMGDEPAEFTGDSVRVDHERIGEVAAHHLYQLGHRSACYLGTVAGYSEFAYGLRPTVFAHHFARYGGIPHQVIEPGIIDHSQGHNAVCTDVLGQALDRCLAQTPRPTALFLEFAMYVPQVWELLAARGIRPGIDLELLVCNNDEIYLRRCQPKPQVVDIPCKAMAALAIRLLVNHRDHQGADVPVRHLVAPQLIV